MRVFKVLFFLFAFCGASFAEPLTSTQFTERFVSALQAEMPKAKISAASELKISVRRGGGTLAEVSLDNAYRSYQADPGRFAELVKAYVLALAEDHSTARTTLDRARIVPVIKTHAWLAELRNTLRPQHAEPIADVFNAELVVVYAEDSKGRTRYLTSAEIVEDRKTLRALAVQNLRRILPKIELRQHGDAFALVTAGGDYEASLLLLDEMWSGEQIKVSGDIVVAVPAKDVLFVTGSRNRKGLKAVRAMIPEFSKGPHGLTEKLFVYRAGKFVKFGKD
jgi:uncharacterized protein YtpQ (UPF0354 family)